VSAAAPWSVKGIDPKAREVAKDLARRSGMTLGEWLNSMIMEGDEDDGVVPLARRPYVPEPYERRSRSRRLDDAYGAPEDAFDRLSASVDAIAGRLEAAERRSTVAIQGVDQAVAGLVRRLDGQDTTAKGYARRIDDIAEELKEGHRRLRRFEQEVGPQSQEAFGKVETSLGALAGRLYDIEERQRAGVNELRQRMDAVEKSAGPGVGSDLLAQVGARLDQAQGRTTEALKGLERSFAELDQRMRAAEGRIEPEGMREAARFEKLAETLSRQVEANRAEMMRRLDTAETENRIDRIERAVLSIGDQVKASEQKGVQAMEAMGREVLRIAENLNRRMQTMETGDAERVETVARAVSDKLSARFADQAARLDQDFARQSERIDQRLTAADDRHAIALEKLGGEIARISDRLSERISQSERRSAQALEDIGRRLAESSDRIEQRHDRASGELAERMRMSEERTARLLAEARGSMEARAPTAVRDVPLESPEPAFHAVAERAQPDWRAAAFPDESFGADEWSADPVAPEAAMAAPFPTTTPVADQDTPVAAETADVVEPEPAANPQPAAPAAGPFGPFGSFGGADVDDALAATAPRAEDGVVTTADEAFGADDDSYTAETDFIDPRRIRASMGAAAAAGRASSTRSAIDAARAAMTEAAEEEPAPRKGFGLKPRRGGKSKLQERLDKQAAKDGSTVKKTFLASATAMALVGGGYGYVALMNDGGIDLPGFGDPTATEPMPIAMSLTPVAAKAAPDQGATVYDEALAQIDAGDVAGLETLKRAANLGHAPAQAHLASLYQTGDGAPVDLAESRRWARRAAEGGDARGMHVYAMELYDGVGGERNRAEALIWLQRAAEGGLVDSQYNVARLYENGDEGIAPNPTEALKWYMIAARGGDQQAQEAVTRLRPTASATAQRAARAAADAFMAQAGVQAGDTSSANG
jgi:localization factor PodJL